MKLNLLKTQLLLKYKHFYGESPPLNRIDIIRNLPTQALLYELAGLNYRIKPKNGIHLNHSRDFQIRELKYFLKDNTTYEKYAAIAERYSKSEDDYPLFFTRQGCVFAIEEILNSNFVNEAPKEEFGTIEHWESIVKYLLAINTEITKIKAEKDDNETNFESINPKLIPLNELGVEINPVYTPFRGYHLIKYYLDIPKYANELVDYFKQEYSLEPEEFVLNILHIYLTDSSENPELNFFYFSEETSSHLLDALSKRIKSTENHKLLNIRKSPFIKVDNQKYLIGDNTFLLEKCYSQLLNDFWFDKLKGQKDNLGKELFNIKDYRGKFGKFFESYVASILKYSFANYKGSTLLAFEELDFARRGGKIELADLYLRYNNKIIIGQVKPRSIYDAEKYGGDVESLYKGGRNKFFEDFGIGQVIESIINIDKHINIFDRKYPKGHQIKVYPCIVVNDKALQTPLMASIFNSRFLELVGEINIPKLLIKPLSLIHISDLEIIQESLNKKPEKIWDFFDENHRHKKFIPPFYKSVYKICTYREYPEKILTLYKELIKKYSQN